MSDLRQVSALSDLQQIYESLQRDELRSIINDALSMKYFADGDKTFVLGEWREWRRACNIAGKALPPADFKKAARG